MAAISIMAGAIAALAAYKLFTWTPEAAEAEPLGFVLVMAFDYADALKAQGVDAALVECTPVARGIAPAVRPPLYACSFMIAGELRRIDCDLAYSRGCYPAK